MRKVPGWWCLATVSAAWALQVGCSSSRAPDPGPVVTDSAGVVVYSFGDRRLGDRSLAATPTVSTDGSAPDVEPLYQISSGRFLPDGSFVVGSRGNDDVRFFSPDGRLRRVVGRRGSGPGEFGSIASLEIVDDSVWVIDYINYRVTVLDLEGEVGRVFPLAAMSEHGLVRVQGVLQSGSLVVTRLATEFDPQPGPSTQYDSVHVVDRDGSSTPLGRFFRAETYWHELEDGIVDSGRPFAPRGRFVSTESSVFYSAGSDFRLEEYSADGTLVAIYTRQEPKRPVRPQDLDDLLDYELAGVERPHPQEARLRKVPLPDWMPAYEFLQASTDGTVWGRPHGGSSPQPCWDVYRPGRDVEAYRVCLPDGGRLLDSNGASVLVVLLDELDVERVSVLGLGETPGGVGEPAP